MFKYNDGSEEKDVVFFFNEYVAFVSNFHKQPFFT